VIAFILKEIEYHIAKCIDTFTNFFLINLLDHRTFVLFCLYMKSYILGKGVTLRCYWTFVSGVCVNHESVLTGCAWYTYVCIPLYILTSDVTLTCKTMRWYHYRKRINVHFCVSDIQVAIDVVLSGFHGNAFSLINFSQFHPASSIKWLNWV